MTENSDQIKLTHEQLAHQLKRRVRILSPLLQKDPEHCYNPMACFVQKLVNSVLVIGQKETIDKFSLTTGADQKLAIQGVRRTTLLDL